MSLAEKAAKISENRATKAEAQLKAALAVIEAQTDEFRSRLEKEALQRQKAMDEESEALHIIITANAQAYGQLKDEEERLRLEWGKEAAKFKKKETRVTTLENKMETMRGKVVSARNRIVTLNTSTPYRPGQVERAIKDVLEDLKNV